LTAALRFGLRDISSGRRNVLLVGFAVNIAYARSLVFFSKGLMDTHGAADLSGGRRMRDGCSLTVSAAGGGVSAHVFTAAVT